MTDSSHVLSTRYASPEMAALFSPHYKYTTWRRLWIALAKAEKKLGLPISAEQIAELEAARDTIDYAKALDHEKRVRHDVVAHILTYGEACPNGKKIIHLGATSAFVTDNTDLIQMHEGLKLLNGKLAEVIHRFSLFAKEHAALPCLGYTHLQPAQPTTVGKRACLWIQDLLADLTDLSQRLSKLRFLGAKGATGTQGSFLALFQGDKEKVQKLDHLIAEEMGFSSVFAITSQTYSRKQDLRIASALSGLAASTHKCATDIRLLAHFQELSEGFSDEQTGSSAMPYKRNPIYAERACGLARFLMSLEDNASYNLATQWLERSLDDSANRRLYLPDAFLTADAILNLLFHIATHLKVFPKRIARNLEKELPLFATENILMEAVHRGGDRQELHEKLRSLTLAYQKDLEEDRTPKNLFEEISKDPAFRLNRAEVEKMTNPMQWIGLAPEQVHTFLHEEVDPLLKTIARQRIVFPSIHV